MFVLGAIVATTACAQDFVDFGDAPEAFAPAKKNTAYGEQVKNLFPEPISQGHLIFNSRLRYEFVEQDGLRDANAFTWRTRIGYETPKYHGFYALAEGEFTIGNEDDFREYPVPEPNPQAVVADPDNAQLNQLFLGWSGYNSGFKGGRQRINIHNQRWVGSVGWRQNDQTFDAVRGSTAAFGDFNLSYTFAWQANRIFGVYAPVEAQTEVDGDNHFIDLDYSGLENIKIGGYFYSFGIESNPSGFGFASSSNSFGLYIDGNHPLSEKWKLHYYFEYAGQTDNSDSLPGLNFYTNYFHAVTGASYDPVTVKFGYEHLGYESNGSGFRALQTPFATLHKFNGFADVFLTTPANAIDGGLQDIYLTAAAKLPANIKASITGHYFLPADGGGFYGREIDLALGAKITENISALIKFAYYDGDDSTSLVGAPGTGFGADRTKLWLQLDFQL